MNVSYSIKRTLCILTALSIGFIIYMIGMMLTTYDGFISIIFQPFVAVLFSIITVSISLMLGLLLRIKILQKYWCFRKLLPSFLIFLSFFLLTFGYQLGFTYLGTNPELGHKVLILHPTIAGLGYFIIIFSITNWPINLSNKTINQ